MRIGAAVALAVAWPALAFGRFQAVQGDATPDIDARVEEVRTDAQAQFGTPPANDTSALPADTLALISWNIQVGGTATSSTAARPPIVRGVLQGMFQGSYQLLAAQEIPSAASSTKLQGLLPGTAGTWAASFADTTDNMDNGFWFRSAVVERDGVSLFHTGTVDSGGRIVVDKSRSLHPPRLAHFACGQFDFTLVTLHLTFQGGKTAESKRELKGLLDFLDVYFATPGHDPDVVICGDFNIPSALSGDTGDDDITVDSILEEDARFQTGERRMVVTIHEKTSRNGQGLDANNYDHFILSADCLEEFIAARRVDRTITTTAEGTSGKLASDHLPIVAFFRTTGLGVARDLPPKQ